jgi:hypothetical protein
VYLNHKCFKFKFYILNVYIQILHCKCCKFKFYILNVVNSNFTLYRCCLCLVSDLLLWLEVCDEETAVSLGGSGAATETTAGQICTAILTPALPLLWRHVLRRWRSSAQRWCCSVSESTCWNVSVCISMWVCYCVYRWLLWRHVLRRWRSSTQPWCCSVSESMC